MSEDKGGFDRYLEPGLIVSVRAEARLEVAAVVSSVVEDSGMEWGRIGKPGE